MTVAKDQKNRVLIVGATGFMGRFITQSSLDSGRPTYVLTRNISKSRGFTAFQDQGANLLQGSVRDEEYMKKILKEYEIDIVISAVGGECLLDQIPLIRAINSVGTIKRFLPSEFGHDVDRADPVEPGLSMYNEKRRVRRITEELGIPYTYICCNSIASWPYHDNIHPSEVLPPLQHFQIYGDGNVKAYFVAGCDIGKFTMKAADDVRTVNKRVHFRPPCNFLNMNELAALWESKIGRQLPSMVVSGDHLLALAAEMIIPESIVAAFTHDIFIKGCQTSFSVDGPNDTEVGVLYPLDTFVTIDVCFDNFYAKLNHKDDNTHLPVGIATNSVDLNYIP